MATKTKKTTKCTICTDGSCFFCGIERLDGGIQTIRNNGTLQLSPVESAIVEANKLGHIVFSAVRYSNPKDWYLVTVEIQTSNDTFVVWTYNATDRGFHNGDYCPNFQELRKTFLRRVSEH